MAEKEQVWGWISLVWGSVWGVSVVQGSLFSCPSCSRLSGFSHGWLRTHLANKYPFKKLHIGVPGWLGH